MITYGRSYLVLCVLFDVSIIVLLIQSNKIQVKFNDFSDNDKITGPDLNVTTT